jgi:HEAT repeat protein
MGLYQITKILMVGLLCASIMIYADSQTSKQILYCVQYGQIEKALDLYLESYSQSGKHDFELMQHLGLAILQEGFRKRDPEIELMTLFGAGISANERTLYILEDGIKSRHPQMQLIALSFLARWHNDRADQALERGMSSNFLLVRLETALQLAKKRNIHAIGQLESLMYKAPIEILPIFPHLCAIIGDIHAMKIMRKLLSHEEEVVRIAAILSAAEFERDDLLPQIRMLASHISIPQQEACAIALGTLKDEISINKLKRSLRSNAPTVQLSAAYALYQLGKKECRQVIEQAAQNESLFAINLLADIPESEFVLSRLIDSQNFHVRTNAALALLERHNPQCVSSVLDILLSHSHDIAFLKQASPGKALTAWKAVPSAAEKFKDSPLAYELSIHMREETLEKALELPEKDFLHIAQILFDSQQNDLVPTLVHSLEALHTPAAIDLLKRNQQKLGAPLIRNYCNLALYRMKEPGSYADILRQWVGEKHNESLIQFRPYIPLEMRNKESSFTLTPHETSRLLVESFEAFAKSQDNQGIEALIHAIRHGNAKNKYALAGLLMRATQ